MNSALESGLKAWLATLLTATEQTIGEGAEAITFTGATIADVLVGLHAFTSNDSMPNLKPWIVIHVHDLPHIVGPLHHALITIRVSTPINLEGLTEDTHRAITSAVRGAFVSANLAALNTALIASANCATSETQAWFIEGTQSGTAEGRWQSHLNLKLCVMDRN